MKRLAMTLIAAFPSVASAATCESLTASYSQYDNAATFFDRASKSETSALRAETAQSALTNILLRQGMILDMLIAKDCDLPNPPDFPMLGLVRNHN